MTREERWKIVTDAIDGIDSWIAPRELAIAITTIVDAWDNDVDAAFTRGIYAEQDKWGAQG